MKAGEKNGQTWTETERQREQQIDRHELEETRRDMKGHHWQPTIERTDSNLIQTDGKLEGLSDRQLALLKTQSRQEFCLAEGLARADRYGQNDLYHDTGIFAQIRTDTERSSRYGRTVSVVFVRIWTKRTENG